MLASSYLTCFDSLGRKRPDCRLLTYCCRLVRAMAIVLYFFFFPFASETCRCRCPLLCAISIRKHNRTIFAVCRVWWESFHSVSVGEEFVRRREIDFRHRRWQRTVSIVLGLFRTNLPFECLRKKFRLTKRASTCWLQIRRWHSRNFLKTKLIRIFTK